MSVKFSNSNPAAPGGDALVNFQIDPATGDISAAYTPGGGGGGSVTHTGALTAGQLVQGNGAADITVGDLSGDVATSGSTATTIQANAVTTSKIAANAVTAAKVDSSVEIVSHKDAANGYAGLDAGTLLKTAEFPAFTGDVTTVAGAVATTIAANAVTTTKINNAAVTEAKIGLSNNTTNDVSITQHGFAPKAPNVATQYLDGTGAYSTPAGTGTSAANLTTAGKGYFLGGGLDISRALWSGSGATASQLCDSPNRVYCIQFVVPYQITINTIKWLEGTTNASQHYSLGIYDATGTTRLITTNSITGAGASLTQKSVTGVNVTLTPGVYWFAFTADATTLITIEGMPLTNTNQFFAMVNNVATYFGLSGNAATAGVLPSSLGTISAQNTIPTSVGIPIVIFGV